MRCTSYCVLAALSAMVLAGPLRAETEAEYANPGAPPRTPMFSGARAPEHAAVPRPRAAPSTMFAAASAAKVRRMSPQQREERQFLREAAASSRFEADAARMALGKSNDPGVRSLAATLINHHASALNELLHMLHARGMAAPMLGNDQRKVLNRLAKLQGAKFDREFLEEVGLRYQQEDVDYFEKASLTAREPGLKAWIDRTLPTLRYHVTTAERIAPADVKLAKATAALPAPAAKRTGARAVPATQTMGGAPAPTGGMQFGGMQLGAMQFGGMQLGGAAQLGVTRPVAARPIEWNTR
jgi:putative membrane protein